MGENGGGSRVWMQMKNESRGWCNFGECSRKTRPCHDFRPIDHLKCGQGENASLRAIRLEKQEQEISHKRSGEVQVGTGCKGKRSRCLHLPEDANSGPIRPQSIKIQSNIFEEQISSTSTKSDSAAIDSEDPERDEVQQPSMPRSRDLGQLRKGNFKEHNEPHCSTVSPPKDPIEDAVRGQKLKLKMELKTRDLSSRTVVLPLGNVTLNLTADFEDQSVDEFEMKTEDSLSFGAGEIHHRNGMETALIDVYLAVEASHRAEHVPFVCLVSKINRKAIIGHPVEIEEIADSSPTCPKFHQLVWRTSKRSPVIYVTNSCASSTAADEQASRGSLRGNVIAGQQKFPKKPGQFKQGTVPLRRTCVPVKHIISNILIAVG